MACVFAVPAHGADGNCPRYMELASQAEKEYRTDDALEFYRRASGSCNDHAAWLALGRAAAAYGEEEMSAEAARAFNQAYELALDNTQEAEAVARYAELVFYTQSDPQRALEYALQAREIDPERAWIAELVSKINERANDLTPADIQRSVLSDMAIQPLRLKQASTATDQTGGSEPRPKADKRSLNIALNFIVASSELDARTASNLSILASELGKVEYAGYRFEFVGHADLRGGEADNQVLSEERAAAIYSAVVAQDASLAERIKAYGAGESRPRIANARTLEEHSINRRLEVVLYALED